MVLAGAASVVLFSAAQFQTRVAELTISGTPLTIWRVEKILPSLEEWNKVVLVQRKESFAAKARLGLLTEQQQLVEFELPKNETALLKQLTTLRERLREATPPPPFTNLDAAIVEMETILARPGADEVAKTEFGRLKLFYAAVVDLRGRLGGIKVEVEANVVSVKALEAQLKERLAEPSRLFGIATTELAPELTDRVINLMTELEALSTMWFGAISTTARWTNDLLVLLLVISMGILGSALHLLAVVVDQGSKSLPLGAYLLRLSYGAVTAIVVFIIAKAGVPIVADTSKFGASAPINPYFVSFLAIVSGLMADRALESIRGAASTLLRTAATQQRWARSTLGLALQNTGQTVADLAKQLGIGLSAAENIVSGVDAASPGQQREIAAFVKRPVSEIFIPPP